MECAKQLSVSCRANWWSSAVPARTSRAAASTMPSMDARSVSRPVKGTWASWAALAVTRPRSRSASASAKTLTGSAKPLAVMGSMAVKTWRVDWDWRAARATRSSTKMGSDCFFDAAAMSRAARLTVGPMTAYSHRFGAPTRPQKPLPTVMPQ